jgi:hypothetical protein
VEPPAYTPVTAVPAYLEPAPRRSRGLVIGVVAAALAVLCGLGGVAGFLLARDGDGGSSGGGSAPRTQDPVSAEPTPPSDSPAPGGSAHTVIYEVSGGSGPAIITYATDGAPAPEQVDLPWRKELTVTDRPNLAMVFALQFSHAPLTCRILVDGQEVTTETSDNSVTCTHVVVD